MLHRLHTYQPGHLQQHLHRLTPVHNCYQQDYCKAYVVQAAFITQADLADVRGVEAAASEATKNNPTFGESVPIRAAGLAAATQAPKVHPSDSASNT